MISEAAPVTLADLQANLGPKLEEVRDVLCRLIEADFGLIAEVNSHLLRMQGRPEEALTWYEQSIERLKRALAKEPDQRYQSTRDLYQELRAIRDHFSEILTAGAARAVGTFPIPAG